MIINNSSFNGILKLNNKGMTLRLRGPEDKAKRLKKLMAKEREVQIRIEFLEPSSSDKGRSVTVKHEHRVGDCMAHQG